MKLELRRQLSASCGAHDFSAENERAAGQKPDFRYTSPAPLWLQGAAPLAATVPERRMVNPSFLTCYKK